MARRDYYNDSDAPAANSIAIAVSAFLQDEQGRILMIRRPGTAPTTLSLAGGWN